MRLAECLNHASVKTLRNIALEQGVACAMYSKLDLMENLLFNMRAASKIEKLVDEWSDLWGESFRRVALHTRSQFSAEEIRGLLHQPNDAMFQKALSQGWLYANSGTDKRLVYVIPDELRNVMKNRLISTWREMRVARNDSPLLENDEQMSMINDMETLLNYVENHEVKLTIEGSMYKKHLQQLMELFEVQEDLNLPEWRFGYGRRIYDYPDRLALLYDFGFEQGMFVETAQEQLSLARDVVEEWRNTPRKIQLQRLYLYYIRLYRKPIPRLREIVETIRLLSTDWVSSASMFRICECQVNDFYYDTPHDVWNTRIIKMLRHLGILRTGSDLEQVDEIWFQITKLGQELLTQDEAHLPDENEGRQASLIVQPNFEIIVIVPDAAMEAQIAQFADLKSTGAMRIYRVLEKTVMRGFHNGHDVSRWKALLTEYGMGPIPGNVERMLDDWTKRHASTDTLTS